MAARAGSRRQAGVLLHCRVAGESAQEPAGIVARPDGHGRAAAGDDRGDDEGKMSADFGIWRR